VAGLKGLQGKALAQIFTHLLMFSDVGVNAKHISRDLSTIANFLSHICKSNDFSQFSYSSLVQKFPQLKDCCHFHPSQELLLLILSVQSTGLLNIPTTRVKLRQLSVE